MKVTGRHDTHCRLSIAKDPTESIEDRNPLQQIVSSPQMSCPPTNPKKARARARAGESLPSTEFLDATEENLGLSQQTGSLIAWATSLPKSGDGLGSF